MLKQLGVLIEQATNDANQEPPVAQYERILDLINSRVDMYLLCYPQAQTYHQWSLQTPQPQEQKSALLLLRSHGVPLLSVLTRTLQSDLFQGISAQDLGAADESRTRGRSAQQDSSNCKVLGGAVQAARGSASDVLSVLRWIAEKRFPHTGQLRLPVQAERLQDLQEGLGQEKIRE